MTSLRRSSLVINKRVLPKYFVLAIYFLFFASFFMIQRFSAQAWDGSTRNASPDKVIAELKGRLNLTEEQETKIRPIIEKTIKKRSELLNSGAQRSDLQQLQWSTDLQIGKILTEDQMKEYEKLREERSEKMQKNDMRQGKGSRNRSRGF